MSGLLFLGIIAVWIFIVVCIVRFVLARVKTEKYRTPVGIVATLLLLPLPVADELLSRPAFDALCEEGTKLKFDPEKILGKTIYLAENPQPAISVGLLHGYTIPWRYHDAITREELISTNNYHLKGGLLMRSFGLPEWNSPLTMRSYCAPPEKPWQPSFLTRYQLKYIERKDLK